MDFDQLQLQLGGVTRSFGEWTEDFVDTYYPDLDQRSYRVPALHFNQQILNKSREFRGLLLDSPLPNDSKWRGDLAHTVVLENMQRLGRLLQDRDRTPLFIISSLDFDNYLAKVKPSSARSTKDRKRKRRTKSGSGCGDLKSGLPCDGDGLHGCRSGGEESGGHSEGGRWCEHHKADVQQRKIFRHEGEPGKSVPAQDRYQLTGQGECASPEYRPPQPVPVSSENRPLQQGTRDWQACGMPDMLGPGSSCDAINPVSISLAQDSSLPGPSNQEPEYPCEGKEEQGRQLPPRPEDRGRQRGEIDVVLLNCQCGVILMEVKSTGMANSTWKPSEDEHRAAIRESVVKAVQQVKRSCDVFHYIMSDLSCLPCATLVVAFPYLTSLQLHKAVGDEAKEWGVYFLTKDDLDTSCSADGMRNVEGPAMSTHGQGSKTAQWWQSSMGCVNKPLSPKDRRTIVGRTCGLLSVVSVWTKTGQLRVEVRTSAQAISQVADRFSHIVLLPSQASLLANSLLTRLCLTGPMGSGKTLLLQLKGRQWVREGRRVVVLNIRSTGRGRPIGYVLQEAIKAECSDSPGTGTVERHDVALNETNTETLKAELKAGGQTENMCIVLDELTFDMFFVVEFLASAFPHSPIWFVSAFVKTLPQGFTQCRLDTVMRSPPSIQLMLRDLDLNPSNKAAYTTRSAARGLPCDGPPIVFIQHKQHSSHSGMYDCAQCADQLVDILQRELGLVFPCGNNDPESVACAPESSIKPGTAGVCERGEEANSSAGSCNEGLSTPRNTSTSKSYPSVDSPSLTFRDVLLLVSMPIAFYRHHGNNQWETTASDVVRFLKYVNTSAFFTRLKELGAPLKVIVDNTSQEIACPSRDEIVVTDVLAVPSLERKVVIFIPGGPPSAIPEAHPSTSSDLNPAPPVSSLRESCVSQPTDSMTEDQVNLAHGETGVGSPSTDQANATHTDAIWSTRLDSLESQKTLCSEVVSATTVSPSTDVEDLVKSNKGIIGCCMEEKELIKSMIENMVIPRHESSEDQPEGSGRPDDQYEESPAQCRMGMTIRGDWPVASVPEAQSQASCDSSLLADKRERTQDSSAKSPFFLPAGNCVNMEDGKGERREEGDCDETEDHRELERCRISEAVSSLSMDDQDWLFMAASRCLSQFIAFIP
ncbi:uncharacterized protein [Littorina saxatilis]|uniref:Uncharacterized protein n=1 Tax=Littorina saxatilis TaxID=31220 RepID=A0AAN9BDY7_9CAEN